MLVILAFKVLGREGERRREGGSKGRSVLPCPLLLFVLYFLRHFAQETIVYAATAYA